jgi:gluconolactonase
MRWQSDRRPVPSSFATILAAWACVGLGLSGPARAQTVAKTETTPLGTIERLDPRFDRLVPPNAQVERIAEGFDWSEGPVWDRKQGRLLFSDVPMNTVFQWRNGRGTSVFLKPSGYTGTAPRGGEPGSNGLLMDSQGRLVLCQHGDRRVARLDGDRFTTLADRYMGKRFNSPNDGVYKSNGDLYFTDPPYGLLGKNEDPAKELDFNGVYRVSAADGTVTLLTREMTFPNGIALSPDEKTLYVANSDPAKAIWMAFPVKEDGTIGRGRLFADVTSSVSPAKKGLPDGMKVDAAGNLFATGPGGVLVFAPDGTHLGTFATGEATANCGWGEDGSVLYITADMYIGRVRLTTRGRGF